MKPGRILPDLTAAPLDPIYARTQVLAELVSDVKRIKTISEFANPVKGSDRRARLLQRVIVFLHAEVHCGNLNRAAIASRYMLMVRRELRSKSVKKLLSFLEGTGELERLRPKSCRSGAMNACAGVHRRMLHFALSLL